MKCRGTICGICPHMRAAGLRKAVSGFAIWSASALMLASVLSGCRKDLCYDHDHWKVNVVTEWELAWERDYGRDWKTDWDSPAGYAYDDLRPSPGNGLAAFVYAGKDLAPCCSTTTIRSISCSVRWIHMQRHRLRPVPARGHLMHRITGRRAR